VLGPIPLYGNATIGEVLDSSMVLPLAADPTRAEPVYMMMVQEDRAATVQEE
jgi:hypothetical protein